MTKGDLIYCYTCGAISIDGNLLKIQDGRFNPNWNYRCGFCYGFKTINASQFLDSNKTLTLIPLATHSDIEILREQGRKLKKQGFIKNYCIKKQGRKKNHYKLFERKNTKKDILKALKRYK